MKVPTKKEWDEMREKTKADMAPIFERIDDRHQKIKDAIVDDIKEAFGIGILVGYLYGRKK